MRCKHCGESISGKGRKYCTVACRLLGNSKQEGECLVWTGVASKAGYGSIKLTCDTPTANAHKLSYETFVGPADGLWVLHRCDNRRCINPKHLFLGTPKDNAQDMHAKGRAVSNPNYGEAHHQTKITEEQFFAIRCDPRPSETVGPEYGISGRTVRLIRRGETWKKTMEREI